MIKPFSSSELAPIEYFTDPYKEQIKQLEAENARLRAALEKITLLPVRCAVDDWDELEEARAIANEALKGQQ